MTLHRVAVLGVQSVCNHAPILPGLTHFVNLRAIKVVKHPVAPGQFSHPKKNVPLLAAYLRET